MGHRLAFDKRRKPGHGHIRSVGHCDGNTRVIHALSRKSAYDSGPEKRDNKDKLY